MGPTLTRHIRQTTQRMLYALHHVPFTRAPLSMDFKVSTSPQGHLRHFNNPISSSLYNQPSVHYLLKYINSKFIQKKKQSSEKVNKKQSPICSVFRQQ